ncbi:MAG: hypothetical protein KKF48_02980 [Nanoarchaeota archaeon]|nr:hypothetical protein [Nanoarchaeota archaeon]MBU1027987.1 hypothetical protein [Nanoarchaeota archaeon]
MKKIIACSIGQTSTERSAMVWGYHIPETKRSKFVQSPNLRGRSFSQVVEIEKENYQIIDYFIGQDIKEKIKEVIKEFFGVEKGIFRINPGGASNEIIEEIRDFVTVHKCRFEIEKFKSNDFADDQSRIYFYLNKLFKEGLIKIPNIPELESQLDKIEWIVEEGKDKVVLPEENQEFVKALINFTWTGGFAFAFLDIRRKR